MKIRNKGSKIINIGTTILMPDASMDINEATLKLPAKPGRYKLAFYLKNTADQYARLSNRTPMAGGYHILHEFDVS